MLTGRHLRLSGITSLDPAIWNAPSLLHATFISNAPCLTFSLSLLIGINVIANLCAHGLKHYFVLARK